MPLGAVLSEEDRKEISLLLQDKCENFWITNGYKKTSIKELCGKADISIGTFYTLYATKEELFFKTLINIQNRLKQNFTKVIKKNPSKEGFSEAMKELFREYDRKPFLYNANTTDFQSFITKLPQDSRKLLKLDSVEFFRNTFSVANLKLKIEEEKAYGTLSALLSILSSKETLSNNCDYFSVFDFMTDHLISEIFE